MNPDDILAVLRAKKVFDANARTWRAYDETDTELTNGSALWRGVHGAILWGREMAGAATEWIMRNRRRRRR